MPVRQQIFEEIYLGKESSLSFTKRDSNRRRTFLQCLNSPWILHATFRTREMITPWFITIRNIHVTQWTPRGARFDFVTFLQLDVNIVILADGFGASCTLLIFAFLFTFTE